MDHFSSISKLDDFFSQYDDDQLGINDFDYYSDLEL